MAPAVVLTHWPPSPHPLTPSLHMTWSGQLLFPLPQPKILLVSKLWSGAMVLSEVRAFVQRPLASLAQTPARFSLLASLHGKVCMGSFFPTCKGSQEATIQSHFFTLPFGDRTWSHGSHVGLCAAQLEEASFPSLPLRTYYKTFQPVEGSRLSC